MKFVLAVATGAVALAAPAAASAAVMTAAPVKPCYGSGEQVTLTGSGFTPSSGVNITRDGTFLDGIETDATGAFGARLTLGLDNGRQTRTYAATDITNATLTASLQLVVSEVVVGIRPRSGPPGRRLRIRAKGFTTGQTLWVHVIRGRSQRHINLGDLTGACRSLTTRRRILPRSAPLGLYRVQFDTYRRYDPDRLVKDLYEITIRPASRGSATAATSFDRID
jgi:hypothetical protein